MYFVVNLNHQPTTSSLVERYKAVQASYECETKERQIPVEYGKSPSRNSFTRPRPLLTVTNYIDKVRVYVRKSGALLSTLSATRERYSLHGPGA